MREATLAAISALAARDDAPAIEAALMTARCIDEDLDTQELIDRLEQLGERFDACSDQKTPWQFLSDEGFGGTAPVDPLDGSHLGTVLETRSGLPITLGALLIDLAGRAGSSAHGVNFPGHFLVRVDASLVDPFGMVERTERECLERLPEEGRTADPFVLADTRAILLRMLNNLKYHYVRAAELHHALEIIECQLAVLPESAGLHLERGEFWYRLGGVEAARAAFADAERLAGVAETEIRRAATARIQALVGREDIRH